MGHFNPEIHHRKSIRYQGFDYTEEGAYFVTVCAYRREHLFGRIEKGSLMLSPFGQILREAWFGLPARFPFIELDEAIVMPNHFHGIVWIARGRGEPCVRPGPRSVGMPIRPIVPGAGRTQGSPLPGGTADGSLGRIVQAFKSIAAVECIRWQKERGCNVQTRIFQRNYYERVIRSESELVNVRQYIHDNPSKWELDPENIL